MSISPSYTEFVQYSRESNAVAVYRRLISDSLTPVTAFHRIDTGKNACLFESVIGGEKVGRYSFLAVNPYLELTAKGKSVSIRKGDHVDSFESDDPLIDLKRLLASVHVAHIPELAQQPLLGGAIGYAGYDIVRYTENLPNAPNDDRQLPDMSFAFYDQLIVFDHVTKTLLVIALAKIDEAASVEEAYQTAVAEVNHLVQRLQVSKDDVAITDVGTEQNVKPLDFQSNFTQEGFEDAVRKCVEYIQAGDIFQVVISQRLETEIKSDPFEIYRTLRIVNPSPFMFFLRTGDVTLVGSSPEVMCRVIDREVTVRPLAGTRRRGKTEIEDRELAEELLHDPKEIAEHVMLVDLGRNDVGRVAKYRTVELSDVMTIERYSHVMHITSNVTGELQDQFDAFDALRACLPAGTVSGAPKVRAMEIIDELEPHRRGPYAGAVGYIDYQGNMDTCIALRTLVVKGNKAYIQAGAGIVADSVPEMEYQETLNKARGILRAIELTEERVTRS
ncbi:MAG: anthranilate synthase component I [Pirellulaceae bacterium]